jgi:hypothetical protein
VPVEESICRDVEAMIARDDNKAIELAGALLNNYASSGHLHQAELFFKHLCQLRGSVGVMLWNIMIKVSNQ